MKKFLPLLIFCLLSSILMAQMPKVINYQAVARNSSGQPLANQTIGVRLSVVNTLAGNASLYSETRTVTTNSLGLFNIQFGAPGANAVTGNFNSVGWVNNTSSSKALKVELDINNSGTITSADSYNGSYPVGISLLSGLVSSPVILGPDVNGNLVKLFTHASGQLITVINPNNSPGITSWWQIQ